MYKILNYTKKSLIWFISFLNPVPVYLLRIAMEKTLKMCIGLRSALVIIYKNRRGSGSKTQGVHKLSGHNVLSPKFSINNVVLLDVV